MKKKRIILTAVGIFLFLFIAAIGTSLYIYFDGLKAIDKNAKENVSFEIKEGEATSKIIANLKETGLIKNELALKIYSKLNPGIPKAGSYIFTKSITPVEIYENILNGKVTYDTVWVTFVEGKRLSYIADVISKNFEFSKETVLARLDDKEYIKTLIKKYDFLTEDILKEEIYHPLEGYLFPDTYEFLSSVTLDEIIEKMLDNTASKLSKYQTEIDASPYSIHELLTLSSIVELEGARSKDREGVAGVFYNRLERGETLGSDVTTYYAVGKDFNVDLSWDDINSCNAYNTRGTCVKKLPIGPIATASLNSLQATIKPAKHDYLFFVADKNGKTYFSKTNSEHINTVSRLKKEGLWYEY